MLRGTQVVLRAVLREDLPLLHAWDSDPDDWPLWSAQPYAPLPFPEVERRWERGETYGSRPEAVTLAVTAGGDLVGRVALHGIDLHNRCCQLGMNLAPEARGRGLGRDAVRTVVRHAFDDRGLHRVSLVVLASNERAVRCYRAAGFTLEGTSRGSAFVAGRFVDEHVMSRLVDD